MVKAADLKGSLNMAELKRKTIHAQYDTGKTKTIKKNGKDVKVPETRLSAPIGSGFLVEPGDELRNGEVSDRWRFNGQFNSIPLNWDGKFVLLDPLQRNGNGEQHENGSEVRDEDIPF